MSKERVYHEITLRSVFKVAAVVALVWAMYLVREALAIIFAAFVLSSALSPSVNWMVRRGLPRWLSVLILYLLLAGVLGSILALLIPPLVDQFQEISHAWPQITERATESFQYLKDLGQRLGVGNGLQDSLSSITSQFGRAGGSVLSALGSFIGGVASVVLVLVLTFYLIIEEASIKGFLRTVLPGHYHPYVMQKLNRIQDRLGAWLRGQLVLGIIIGVVSYIGLTIAGVPYALLLALLAGTLELLPYIGPILTFFPMVIVAAGHSSWSGIFIAIWFIVLQQLENNFLVPNVMRKAIGLNPIVVLVAILIGARLGGLVGVILAVPTATIISILVMDLADDEEEVLAPLPENQLES